MQSLRTTMLSRVVGSLARNYSRGTVMPTIPSLYHYAYLNDALMNQYPAPMWNPAARFDKDKIAVPQVDKKGFRVSVDVAGFRMEELTVKALDDKVIVIEGKSEELQESYGSFASKHFIRKYTVPSGFDTSKAISTLTPEGLLTINIPSPFGVDNAANERVIPIQTSLAPLRSENQNEQLDQNAAVEERYDAIPQNPLEYQMENARRPVDQTYTQSHELLTQGNDQQNFQHDENLMLEQRYESEFEAKQQAQRVAAKQQPQRNATNEAQQAAAREAQQVAAQEAQQAGAHEAQQAAAQEALQAGAHEAQQAGAHEAQQAGAHEAQQAAAQEALQAGAHGVQQVDAQHAQQANAQEAQAGAHEVQQAAAPAAQQAGAQAAQPAGVQRPQQGHYPRQTPAQAQQRTQAVPHAGRPEAARDAAPKATDLRRKINQRVQKNIPITTNRQGSTRVVGPQTQTAHNKPANAAPTMTSQPRDTQKPAPLYVDSLQEDERLIESDQVAEISHEAEQEHIASPLPIRETSSAKRRVSEAPRVPPSQTQETINPRVQETTPTEPQSQGAKQSDKPNTTAMMDSYQTFKHTYDFENEFTIFRK